VLRAIGTEFSVRRESEGVVDALVSKGSIEVITHGRQGATQVDSSAERRVDAGQAIRITSSRVEIAKIGSLGVTQRLAWTAGMIDFDGTLAEAVSEFNRYNSRRLVIVDPSIAAKHIQGLFKATDPDAFAQELQRAFGIPYSGTAVASANSGLISLGVTR
jgi:transmembrane sensor